MAVVSTRLLGCFAVIAVFGASACTPIRTHQGYVLDGDLVNAVQVGVDNRESVLGTLGRPTFTSQFNDGEWFYLSRESRNLAFNNPNAKDQTTLRIRFDAKGTVTSVDKMGAELIASVDPTSKKTPTLGRKRSIFEDLFGNIGTVGAVPGAAGQGGDGQ